MRRPGRVSAELPKVDWLNVGAFNVFLVFVLTVSQCACAKSGSANPVQKQSDSSATALHPYSGHIEPDDGQWIRPAKDFASTRYSSLDQINRSNVKTLKMAWSFSTGTLRGLEAAPLIVNNTLYLVTPWPNTL